MSIPDLESSHWRRSTHSDSSGGNCVELAGLPAEIAVRDSKDPDGPVLTFTPDEWRAFTLGVQDGEFDVT